MEIKGTLKHAENMRAKGCLNKLQYNNEGQAKAKAHQLKMRAYHCPSCNKYHLTTSPKH